MHGYAMKMRKARKLVSVRVRRKVEKREKLGAER